MAVTRLDPFGQTPTTVVPTGFAVTTAPTVSTDGYITDNPIVRLYFVFAGAVTSMAARVWVRRADTGAWFVFQDVADLGVVAPSATAMPVRDIPVGSGNEFYVQVTAIAPGTAGNTVTILAEGVDSTFGQINNTELSPLTLSDTLGMPGNGIPPVFAVMGDFNGSSYERYRHNESRNLQASAARTTALVGTDQTLYGGTGLMVLTNVTAGGGGVGITVFVEGKELVSGAYYTLLQSAAITALGLYKLIIDPRIPAVPSLIAQHPIPRVFRVRVAVGDATSFTYSQSLEIVP